MENFLPDTAPVLSKNSSNLENKEQEFIYELRDVEGGVRCNIKVTFINETLPESLQGRNCKVLKRVLRMSFEGAKSVDIFALCKKSEATKVFFTDDDYRYEHTTDEVFIPEFKTLIDLYIAFHEIGHAVQYKEDIFKNACRHGKFLDIENFAPAVLLAREKRVAIPMADEFLNELMQYSVEYNRYCQRNIDGSLTEDDHIGCESENIKFTDFLKEHEIKESLVSLISYELPRSIFERDATLRAMVWVRKASQELHISLNFKTKRSDVVVLDEMSKELTKCLEEDDVPEEVQEAILRVCGMGNVGVREVMNLALLTQESDKSVHKFFNDK